MKFFLRFLYKRYQIQFEEFMVQDLIENIPTKVHEESLEWLAKGKDTLEKWIMFQSYHIQRRAVGDTSKAQIYHGMGIYLKTLLAIVQGTKMVEKEFEIQIPQQENSDTSVVDFLEGMKKLPRKEKNKKK